MTQYQDNRWVDKENLTVSAFDLSVLRGFGVFDFLKVYNRRPFRLDDHIDRLFDSAQACGLSVPKSKQEVRDIVLEGVKRNENDDQYVKLILTGGVSADGITPGQPSFLGIFQKAGTYPPENFTRGVKLITVPFQRYIPSAKSLNYFAAVVNMQKAKKEGAEEVLYITEKGSFLEGSTFNFFVVKGGKLYTTKDDILPGITRKVVFEIVQKEGIDLIVGEVFLSDLPNWDEAFMTSTTREVMPVRQLDDKIIAKGEVGPVTKRLQAAFKEAVRA